MRLFAVLFGLYGLLGAVTPAQAGTYSEASIKAAYLHRFAAYVQWPAGDDHQDPFVFGVVGAEEVAAELEQLLPALTIQNRRAVVRRIPVGGSLEGVQILYIGAKRLPSERERLTALQSKPVLLVTDDPKGLARGGIINFVQVNRSIRFEVSLSRAERSGLKINSGLLSVAARVEGVPEAHIRCPDFLRSEDDCQALLALRATPSEPSSCQAS